LRTRKESNWHDQGGTDKKILSRRQDNAEKPKKPVVYELKLQNLSKKKSDVLRKAFLEAKWLYNWLVSIRSGWVFPPTR